FQEQPSRYRLVDSGSKADWLIQIAALERPDILYITPPRESLDYAHDAHWRMSPPGDAASAWLAAELEALALERQWQSMALPLGVTTERAFLGIFRKGPAEDL